MSFTPQYKPGDTVVLSDGAEVQVVSRESDVKNGRPGGDGITLNDPGRRSGRDADDADRWFYDYQITRVVEA